MAAETHAYPILSPETRANPQALYERMRAENPIYRATGPNTGRGFWLLTRYDDCVAALKDPRLGKQIDKYLSPEEAAQFEAGDSAFEAIDNHLLNLDPPDHTRLRALVHKAFTPRMIENLRPRIAQIATDLLDAMGDSGETDLIDAFAFPLPITVIAEMLGVPVEDRERFRRWSNTLLFDSSYDNSRMAALEFAMYMHSMIDERQTNPRDDLITALVQAEESGDTLSRAELLSMIFILLVAGHETTVNLIGNGTLALIQHRDQFDKLCADPSLIRTAVEEMLRFNGPVETPTWRFAFEDIEWDGHTIPKGEVVLPVLLAANRDPAHFEDPNRFDITRDPNRHIAFGSGIHYCLGAPLARMEGAIAIRALVERLPNIDLAVPVEQLEWNNSLLIHGMRAMPVRY